MLNAKEGISLGGKVITGSGPTAALTAADVGTGAYSPAYVLPNAIPATTVTATGNINGANLISSTYTIRGVATGISAAGSTQGTATVLAKDINVVSTVLSGNGVQLPAAVAGMNLFISNTSANSLLVYPATSGYINTLAINTGLTMGAGATLQFIAPTTTQWYSVGATFA